MKLNIVTYGKPTEGYININLFTQDINQEVLQAECEHIVLEDVIGYVKYEELFTFFSQICSKLRHNGKLTIIDFDIIQVSKAFISTEIDQEEFNRIVFGDFNTENRKRSIIDLGILCDILDSMGLKIIYKKLSTSRFIVEAIRP